MGEPTPLAPKQLDALARLTATAGIEGYYLGGGTAIAWHLRHRHSADLDLFTRDTAAAGPETIVHGLEGARVIGMTDAAAHLVLDGVPVDIVRYPYPLLEAPVPGPSDFPVAGLRDLAAMKLAAIANRGIRRDFWDLYAICQAGPTLDEALNAYQTRFGRESSDLYHVIRALSYFGDAERDAVLPRGLSLADWGPMRAWFEEQAARVLLERR